MGEIIGFLAFLFIAGIGLLVFCLVQVLTLRGRVAFLERELRALRNGATTQPVAQPRAPAAAPPMPAPMAPAPAVLRQEPPRPQTLSQPQVQAQPRVAPVGPPQPSAWSRFEKHFSQNWTGIVGAIVLVLGIGFLGVYAALKFSEVYRFFTIVGTAALLHGIYYYLKSRPRYAQLGLWVGSASVAVFLFACYGAGHIPGLQWVESTNTFVVVGLLALGIAANYCFAFVTRSQVFVSIQTALSLLALSLDANDVTLVLAIFVTLASLAFAHYKQRWDVQLLVTVASFFVFFMAWRFGMGDIPETSRLSAIAGAVLVAVAAGLVHYRKDYASPKLLALPFIVHLLNWTFVGVSLVSVSTASRYDSIALGAAAIAAFFLARHGRKKGITWVYRTDMLMSQALAILALYTLTRWGIDPIFVFGIMVAQSFAFAALMLLEKDKLLSEVGVRFGQLCMLVFVAVLPGWREIVPAAEEIQVVAAAGAVLVAALVYHAFIVRSYTEARDYVIGEVPVSVVGFLMPLLIMAGYFVGRDFVWAEAIAAGLLIALIVLRQRYELNGMGCGLIVALVALFASIWNFQINHESAVLDERLIRALPLFVALGSGYALSRLRDFSLRGLSIYMLGLHFVVTTYFIGMFYSPLVAGMVWLLSSLVLLETFHFLSAKDKRENGFPGWHILNVAYALVALFIVDYVRLYLPLESYLWILKTRTWIGVVALATFAYWYFSQRPAAREYKTWGALRPLFLELMLILAGVNVALLVPNLWHAATWMVAALALYFIGHLQSVSRLRFYSMVLAWVSGVTLAAMVSTTETPSLLWYAQPWFAGSVTLALQVAYLVVVTRRNIFADAHFPQLLAFLEAIDRFFMRAHMLWIFYPFFVTTAVFLYWRFSSAILTLLWVAECFIIFSLSMVLRIGQFRIVAMIALGACLIRLVVYDLRNTDMIIRGVVFVGVGALMLAMNYLYRRFKPEDK